MRLSRVTTKRLTVRPLRVSDRDEFVALARDSKRFLAGAASPPMTTRAFFSYLALGAARDFSVRVIELSESGELLGTVTVSQMLRGSYQSASVGYWIGVAHANKGFMREAMARVVTELFCTYRLHRLEANVQPTNRWSKRLLRGLGFRREGYSRRLLKIRGRWCDHERWAILREDLTRRGRTDRNGRRK